MTGVPCRQRLMTGWSLPARPCSMACRAEPGMRASVVAGRPTSTQPMARTVAVVQPPGSPKASPLSASLASARRAGRAGSPWGPTPPATSSAPVPSAAPTPGTGAAPGVPGHRSSDSELEASLHESEEG